MNKSILYKVIQRRLRFRNPQQLTELPKNFIYSEEEYNSAKEYILNLAGLNINYSHPEKDDYPTEFLKMKEPPLFFEYYGTAIWKQIDFISVVGSREINPVSESWMKQNIKEFLKLKNIGVVSGGARGIDQLSHLIAIKNNIPTIFVLPSGLKQLYPPSLEIFKRDYMNKNICFITEFENDQKIHKSHFYIRNRLIAALGKMTLVVQASLKSGSLLTVHHCLEMGKSVVTIPAHPEMIGFDGNLKLIYEGAYSVRNFEDLHDFWEAENWPN